MDNFSQNTDENEEKELDSETETKAEPITEMETEQKSSFDNSDIQFEESLNVEEIQRILQENPEIDIPDVENEKESASQLPSVVPAKNSKKYVIYINPDNIDFMESLSIVERRELINKILKEQNNISKKKKEFDAKKRYFINVFLACLTFIICFPVLFILVNKAMEITIANYNRAKENFSQLYKEEGKIRRNDVSPSKNADY